MRRPRSYLFPRREFWLLLTAFATYAALAIYNARLLKIAEHRRRTAEEGIASTRTREVRSSPFYDFRISRGLTWLEPTLTVEVTYSEIREGWLRDPVYRGIA